MANYLRNFILKYRYPQYIFSKAINKYLDKINFNKIIDIPCGNGITTYWLSKSKKNISIIGCDQSEQEIKFAKENLKSSGIHFEIDDIFRRLDVKEEFDIICIINSLFCFENNELILSLVCNALKHNGSFITIIPNVNGTNFKNFMRSNNPQINVGAKSLNEFKQMLDNYPMKLLFTKKIAYTFFYGRRELKYFSYVGSLYLIVLNYFESLFKLKEEPNYFLLVYQKIG